MDVGIFMVSPGRLKAWLIIPPLLMVSVGLGSYAWQQRAEWQLQETKALSELLPTFIAARRDTIALFEEFKTSSGGELGSEDQLISFLQDMAQHNNFMVGSVNVIDKQSQKQKQQDVVPVLKAVVRGQGDFTAVQLYINEVKSKQSLLSVDSIKVMEPSDRSVGGTYDVEIVFELLLLDGMQALNGEL